MTDRVPRVSICVPSIGRVEYLAATRASIEAQTFRDFEVLALDNASSAEGRALFEDWATADQSVRLMRSETRVPMFENFNRGIDAARGEYLTFCHDDDTVEPEFLARHVEFQDSHPRVGFSGSNYDYIDEYGRVTERRSPVARTEAWSGRRYIRALVRGGRNPLTMQSIFYRRAALDLTGIDVRLPIHYGDFVFLMRIAERWDVGLLSEPLVAVRRHAAQASRSMTNSVGIPLRTAVLRAYVAELTRRVPWDVALVTELRATLELSHGTGLFWGWLSAANTEEARACAAQLGTLGGILNVLDHVVPTATDGRRSLVELARRFANGRPSKGESV